jgi:hypothetical protein
VGQGREALRAGDAVGERSAFDEAQVAGPSGAALELERACAAFRAEAMARARSARHAPAALFATHAGKLVLTRVQALYALSHLGVDSIEQSRHLHLGRHLFLAAAFLKLRRSPTSA